MTYTSIFEKILLIINIISTSWIYIFFMAIIATLIALLAMKKISKKICFILVTISTKLLLGYTFYMYYEPINTMINTLVDNIFLNIYFPSAYAYLFILLITNIITIANLLKPRGEKIYKTVNGVCFIITNFILVLILETIAKNKIDIFAKESLFTNTNLITLLEFSVNIFIIWIVSLIAIYLINNVTERILIAKENKKLINEPANTITTALTIENPELKPVYEPSASNAVKNPVQAIVPETYEYKFIPNFTITTKPIVEESENKFIPKLNTINKNNNTYSYNYNGTFDLSSFIPKKQEIKPINTLTDAPSINNNAIFEQILNNELPVIEEPAKTIEEVKNSYTLNDYRIFNKMLKDIREHNQSNSITIDKNLEYRLITKYSTETYNMFKTMLKIYSN